MGFHENALFPETISYGSRGGPGFSTSIITKASGHEERVARWAGAGLRSYDAKFGVKTKADIAQLQTFVIARLGPAFGFRYKDWGDFSTGADHTGVPTFLDTIIATADGSTTQFQLVKRYTDGDVTRVRNIRKIVAGSVIISINNSQVDTGWSVNPATGVLTFDVAPLMNTTIRAGFYFHVPCRFGKEIDGGLPIQFVSFENFEVSSIPIYEILDDSVVSEEYPYRGSVDWGVVSSDVSISPLNGFLHAFAPGTTGHKVILPAASTLPSGAPHFMLWNTGSENLSVVNEVDSQVVLLAPTDIALLAVGIASASFVWVAQS